MSKGADVMKEVPIWGNSLCIAAEYGCISGVKYLLDCATPVNYTNCKGNGPLLVACGSEVSNVDNSTAIIDLLISKGADLHHKSIEGYTAMHQAALSDKVRHVQTLLAHVCHLCLLKLILLMTITFLVLCMLLLVILVRILCHF